MWLSKNFENTKDIEQIPERYNIFIESWKKYNPQYKFIFWNNINIQENIWNNKIFLPYKKLLSKMRLIEKCDISRYMIMYLIGGIYIDLNTECYRNIDKLIENKKIILSKEPVEHTERWGGDSLVTNSFLASEPRNQFWLDFIEYIDKNYWNHKDVIEFVMINTGPAILGRFSINYFGNDSDVFINNCLTQPLINKQTHSELSHYCEKKKSSNELFPFFAKKWEYTAGWGQHQETNLSHKKISHNQNFTIFVIICIIILLYFLYF